MIKLFLILVMLSSIPFSYAGNETGHGGNGVLCEDQSGQQTRELLDLWSGEAHGLSIVHTNASPVQTQLEAALEKLEAMPNDNLIQSAVEVIRGEIQTAMKVAHFVDEANFPVAQDAGVVLLPANCSMFGIGFYQDGFWFDFLRLGSGSLQIEQSVFTSLSNTDQAAFWLHEGIYRAQRSGQEKTSVLAQQIVAIDFSSADWTTPLWPL